MARSPINYGEVEAVASNAFLRDYFDATAKEIFERWTVVQTVAEREELHARFVALMKLKAGLYGECKRIIDGKHR